MKIQFYVKFYASFMGIFISNYNAIHKYLYEEFLYKNLESWWEKFISTSIH